MTEDTDRKVDIEIYADDTEGNKIHRTGLLSSSGFPYLSGGANSIAYTNVRLGEDEGYGWQPVRLVAGWICLIFRGKTKIC